MMTKQEVEQLLNNAMQLTVELLERTPDDSRLKYVKDELDRIKGLMKGHWSFNDDEKANIHIGVFAVRELEGFHDELAVMLEHLNYEIDNS